MTFDGGWFTQKFVEYVHEVGVDNFIEECEEYRRKKKAAKKATAAKKAAASKKTAGKNPAKRIIAGKIVRGKISHNTKLKKTEAL